MSSMHGVVYCSYTRIESVKMFPLTTGIRESSVHLDA
jgi:hypothetical protein